MMTQLDLAVFIFCWVVIGVAASLFEDSLYDKFVTGALWGLVFAISLTLLQYAAIELIT